MDVNAYIFDYLPVLFTAVAGFGVVFAILSLARLIAPRQQSEQKSLVYECGMLPIGRFGSQVHVRYYLFAILFMIFEVEVVFLFPWAVSLKEIGLFGFFSMMVFLAVLGVGFMYEWRKGALEWE